MALTPSPSADPTTPTPTFTGGIDPPTEPPEAFSEFAIPHPDDLTEQYAAWVLAEIYRAETTLISMAVDRPERSEGLSSRMTSGVQSVFSGPAADVMPNSLLELVQDPKDGAYAKNPEQPILTNIELIDSTQRCLLVRYVIDASPSLKQGTTQLQQFALLEAKPQIDGSRFNRTPWRLSNRASPEDVNIDRCPV